MEQRGDTAKAPKLLDQVRLRMRAKHYSLRTEQSYLHWIKRLSSPRGKRQPKRYAVFRSRLRDSA